MGEANGTVPVLIVTGPVGVGKTTTAMAVSDELERSGVAHAWVDIDQLAQCFPRPADDRFHSRLARRNLTAVCANFLDAGAGRLVFPLVIEDQAGQDTLAACIPGADLTVVRLTVRPETNVARFARPGIGGVAGLAPGSGARAGGDHDGQRDRRSRGGDGRADAGGGGGGGAAGDRVVA